MMDLSVTLVKGFQPVTNIAKNSILDIAGVQNLPLKNCNLTLINISFRSNWGQGPGLKLTYIFKTFRAQIYLTVV